MRVDAFFQNALPALTEEEFRQLEENIVTAGEIYEPLVLWGEVIVDGHNRFAVIQKHPELEGHYKTRQMDFVDKWAALEWACKNQLGKRNLSEEQKTYTLGKMYEARKHVNGETQNRGKDGRFRNPTNEDNGGKTATRIGEEVGVSHVTVERAYDYVKAVDAAEEEAPGFRDKALSGELKATRREISRMNKMDDEERKESVQALMRGEKMKKEPHKEVPKYEQQTEEIPIGSEPYNEDDFADQIGTFPKDFDDNIRLFLLVHGDMLSIPKCKAAFFMMLKKAEEVIKKYKEVANNEH